MELTLENVQAVFLDSLALDSERAVIFRVKGLFNEFSFNQDRLEGHRQAARDLLAQVSTRFYADRGGGHSCLGLGARRDGVRWGERPDIERLVVLGLGLGLLDFCLPREQWGLFPGNLPYVRIQGDVFRLWVTFHRPLSRIPARVDEPVPGERISLAFSVEDYPPPPGVKEEDWYRPSMFRVSSLPADEPHVVDSIYNRIVVDGFFSANIPSWILESAASIQVY